MIYSYVQGHKVKYSNCNNSAADSPISLKFGTEFDHGTEGTLQMFKVKGQRLNEFKLGTGDEIKADRDCSASGCLELQCIRNCHVL